jgi:excisionase family DNA binding protein
MEQRYLSVSEVAAYTGLGQQTIYKWAEAGTFPGAKVGRIWRFDRLEVDAFMKGNRNAA